MIGRLVVAFVVAGSGCGGPACRACTGGHVEIWVMDDEIRIDDPTPIAAGHVQVLRRSST